MKSTISSVTVLCLALALAAPAPAAERPRLGDIVLGEQVWGPVSGHYDLEGRVVLIFHWCVSCPISTGTFPYVNHLAEKYGDRGLRIVGMQVRRSPDVAENDVVWALSHLKPEFPIFRLGPNRDWPRPWLPWAVVYDHEGREVFAGGLEGIEPLLDDLLAKAPDPLLGGPWEKLAARVRAMDADREHLGRHLPEVRRIAEDSEAAPAEREEAQALLAAVRREFERRMTKAARDVYGSVQAVEIYRRLATRFEGDVLAGRARDELERITGADGWPDEQRAWRRLEAARAAHRWLPPPGRYLYHPTEMPYEFSDDPALRARRIRMLAAFRRELARIERTWPETDAAAIAFDLLLGHPMITLTEEEATARLARADERLEGDARPGALFEAYFSLVEVAEGRPEEDPVGKRARERLADLEVSKESELAAAIEKHRRLEGALREVIAEIEAGGSALPREEADELAGRLTGIAKEAGRESGLDRRVRALVAELRASYDGPARLGVGFDGEHEGPGVRVGRVYRATAAAVAGLEPGDVILAFGDREVGDAEDLRDAILARRPGDRVTLRLRRAGRDEPFDLDVTLGRPVR